MSVVNKMKNVIFVDFSDNTFPIETFIINLFHYIWGVRFIHKDTQLH